MTSDNAHYVLLAQYNQWMNRKLYEVCSTLSEDELRLDRRAFFGSLYLTLNHILYADMAFLSRFTGDPPEAPALGVELAPSFPALRSEREAVDCRIIDWVATLDASWLNGMKSYTSKVDGKMRTLPRWVLLTHMFNHQTHHRGQVTTMLTQLGLDVGTTDIPFMPQFAVK